ncbi:MAG: hypothetical protein AB7U72_14255 [Methanosarcina sp.]
MHSDGISLKIVLKKQRNKNTKKQKHKETKTQRNKNAKKQKHKDMKLIEIFSISELLKKMKYLLKNWFSITN